MKAPRVDGASRSPPAAPARPAEPTRRSLFRCSSSLPREEWAYGSVWNLIPVVRPRSSICWSVRVAGAFRLSTCCSSGTGPGCGAGREAACRGGHAASSTPATWFTTRSSVPSRTWRRSSPARPRRCGPTSGAPSRTGSETSCGVRRTARASSCRTARSRLRTPLPSIGNSSTTRPGGVTSPP